MFFLWLDRVLNVCEDNHRSTDFIAWLGSGCVRSEVSPSSPWEGSHWPGACSYGWTTVRKSPCGGPHRGDDVLQVGSRHVASCSHSEDAVLRSDATMQLFTPREWRVTGRMYGRSLLQGGVWCFCCMCLRECYL